MRKIILVSIIGIALTGCVSGVSQKEYDTLQDKYDSLQDEYEDLNETYDIIAEEYANFKTSSIMEKSELEQRLKESENQTDDTVAEESIESDGAYTFSPGEYSISAEGDIPPGVYDIKQLEGVGHLTLYDASGKSIESVNNSFNNLTFEDGCYFKINTTAIYQISIAE